MERVLSKIHFLQSVFPILISFSFLFSFFFLQLSQLDLRKCDKVVTEAITHMGLG